MVNGYKPVHLTDFRDAYPRYNVCLDNMSISSEDGNCWMNLERFMHPNPHRVPLNASLPSVFRLFRGLGLRYLIVVDDDNLVSRCREVRVLPIDLMIFVHSNNVLFVGQRCHNS